MICDNTYLNAISNELGIIRHLYAAPRDRNDPYYYTYAMESTCFPYLVSKEMQYEISAGGYAKERSNAFLGLLGETLERYSSAFIPEEEKIIASYRQLIAMNKQAIAPENISIFHSEQFQKENFSYAPFTQDLEVSWFPMLNLVNGEKVYYPGSLIYMPYFEEGGKNVITLNNSTGLAAHTNREKALLSAIYEVIERDAFSISWFQKLPVKKIILDESIKKYIRESFPYPYEIVFMDISLDWNIPIIAGLCFGVNEFGKFVVCAAATRWTYNEAIEKVIQELGQSIPYAKFLFKKYGDWKVKDDYSDVDGFDKHAALYNKNKDLWKATISEWRNKEAEQKIPSPLQEQIKNQVSDKEKIQRIINHCRSKNYDLLVKDITTVDAEQLGFRILRAQIPQAIPLGGDYKSYFLGGKRLYEVPEKLGYKSYPFSELNTIPHPFP